MVLCFDIGGTSIKYGAAHDPGGEIVFSSRWETPTDAKTLGGAVVLDGKVWHGHAGSAGEIGYMPVNGRAFEQQASTTALIRRVAEQTGETLDGRQIFARAQAGDTVCAQAIDALCGTLAQGVAACMCVMDPAAVVLGGGIMGQSAYLRPLLESHLQRFANPFMLAHTRLAFAELGNSAGMAGAYRWLQQQAL